MDPNKKIIGTLEQIRELIKLELSNEFIIKSILDFVKNALEKKIIDRKQNFVKLLHKELYIWLRMLIGPSKKNLFWERHISEAKVQSVIALVNGLLMTIKQLKGRVLINLDEVEIIANDTPNFNNLHTGYLLALNVIKRIIDTALINPGINEDIFIKGKQEIILHFERLAGEEIETHTVKSRKRKTRKNNKTRKYK
jgi:hypothetical protein